MLFQVYTENGVKKIKPLTADTGTGAPVGSYLYLEKKSNPQGYLYCDGSTFDSSVYPALYQYLGSNVLPDFREFSPVGAEQNTTNVYDASTNPSGVIHDHDVYTQGEAKDDQLQQHRHYAEQMPVTGGSAVNVAFSGTTQNLTLGNVTNSYRNGTVTRGKRKAVFVYIKATSGLTENQQENVLNTINENLSYSTTEHPTGKKWIDGKLIYQKVVDFATLPDNTTKQIAHNISNIDTMVKYYASADNGTYFIQIPRTGIQATDAIDIFCSRTEISITTKSNLTQYVKTYVTLEYTKTTD